MGGIPLRGVTIHREQRRRVAGDRGAGHLHQAPVEVDRNLPAPFHADLAGTRVDEPEPAEAAQLPPLDLPQASSSLTRKSP